MKCQLAAGKNPSLEVPLFLAIKREELKREEERKKDVLRTGQPARADVVCGGRTCIKTLAKNAQ